MSNKFQDKLKIGITLGDINGIGPELVLKAFSDSRLKEICIPIVYGSSRVLNIYRKILGIEKFHYTVIQNPRQAQFRKLNLIECMPNVERVDIGKASESGGKAAYLALKRAIEDAQHETLDALITLPVDKASVQAHEPDFIGHTEMLTKAFNANESLMFMVHEDIKVGLVTNHLPIAEVSRNISAQRILTKLKIMEQSLFQDFNIQRPLMAVLGLNPHAGDDGLIGKEENEILSEALDKAKQSGMLVEGPYSSDGFFGSMTYRKFDGILAMYHDQGLIPFKLLAGFEGVNFTAGIPIVRTSPDHGVAYDIVGKNIASTDSLRHSIYMTIDMFRNRTENKDLKANALRSRHAPQVLKDDSQEEIVPLEEEAEAEA